MKEINLSKTLLGLSSDFIELYNSYKSGISETDKRVEIMHKMNLNQAYYYQLLNYNKSELTRPKKSKKNKQSIMTFEPSKNLNTKWVTEDELEGLEGFKDLEDSRHNQLDSDFFCNAKSVLYGPEGEVKLIWEKSKLNEKQFYENMKLAITDMISSNENNISSLNKSKAKKITKHISDEKLMTFYPIPDAHLGLLIDSMDTTHGKEWNLKEAVKSFKASFDYLIESSPNSDTCVISDLGDLLESDDDSNRTKRSGNILNTSDMHSRIIKETFELIVYIINKAKTKHNKVYFYSVPGNHADLIPLYLTQFLNAYYKDDKQVIIDIENKQQAYFHFGKNLLGFTHGHMLSPDTRCAEAMIHDNRKIFSDIQYAYFHFGHYHHNKKSQEMSLVNVEIHKNLPPTNKWASSMGFRSQSLGEAKSITYHKDFGEISRNIFNIHFLD